MACPCGLGTSYDGCCGRLHRGDSKATTAERVMRARYTAFVVGDDDYLTRSWHPATRPRTVTGEPGVEWLGLDVLGVTGGGPFDSDGTVEFAAHYRAGTQDGVLHERSRFVRHEREWVYLDAVDGVDTVLGGADPRG